MNYYKEIKESLINNEIVKKAKDYSKNRSDLDTYYNVGRMLKEAGKNYGEGIIKEYAFKLSKELGKTYSYRTLFKMRQLFIFCESEKMPTLSAKLSWSHYYELLGIKNINKINYYIEMVEKNNLSVRELRNRIKSKEYERLDDDTKEKLINKKEEKIEDFIKNPIIIRNKNNTDVSKLSEKMLKALIIEDIEGFLKELGEGFCYIKNEYKIKIGDSYNYIDLLLFNYVYNCFVVIELKVTALKKEHVGQIMTYMNYIDKHVKSVSQDKTIGVIITRKENMFVMEYVSDIRIFTKEFCLN